ncbi:MAG: HAD-IG family 5'-nucleotidase [Candidatus Sericytochromatia bacterium]|nr:HAD-IG family 5'-nucleotidase [Candidatus Sericytochromatia bacterium]
MDDSITAGIAEGARNIFVNRNLNIEKISVIGFDMDYTLAIYFKQAIEELAFDLTIEQMIAVKGYPAAIGEFRYDPGFAIRGLLLDKLRGNLLKINRFKVVGRVMHGTRPMTPAEVLAAYERKIDTSDKHLVSIDTLFSLPEANLFALLVDYLEDCNDGATQDYIRIFDDIKECIDMIHNDGSLKGLIALDVPKYIYKDPYLALTLDKMRQSGKKLFLLTNSYWEYTQLVMTYLLHDELATYPQWQDYFDVIMVGARKPGYFLTDSPFWVCDPVTEELTAFDGERFEPGVVYQHGNIKVFEQLIGHRGDQILYIGDHIFGDILRSAKNGNWRTALVIQELEDTIHQSRSMRAERTRLTDLEELRQKIDRELLLVTSKIGKLLELPDPAPALAIEIQRLQASADELKGRLGELVEHLTLIEEQIDTAHHPYWGEIFTERAEVSRFGEQIRDYACIYTSRVSNFLLYPTDYTFKAVREWMSHERLDLVL